jgi:hypothetical protein
VLLAFGVYFVWGHGSPKWPAATYAFPAVVLALLLVPTVREIVGNWSRRLAGVNRAWIFLAIWILATAYLAFTAKRQERVLIPLWTDESSYLVLAQHISVGRLWMPEPPAADSFETTYVHVKPVYASIYFVGGGLFYALALLVHAPPWMMAVAIAGLLPAVLFLVMAELIDPLSAIAGALLLISPWEYRYISIRVLSNLPVLLLYLAGLWGWLRFRRQASWRWIAFIGAMAGWAAITRPLEAAIGFGLIGVMMLWQLRTMPTRRSVGLIAVGCAAAMPFLILQGISNKGISGSWLTAPWTSYVNQDYPNSGFGFHRFDPSARPTSALPQKQKLYVDWVLPMVKEHRVENVWHQFWWNRSYVIPWAMMPHPWLFFLVPLGFIGVRDPRKAAVLLVLPLLVVAYTFYYWLPPHYLMLAMLAVVLAVLWAIKTLTVDRWQPTAMLVLMALCIGQMSEVTGLSDDMPAYPQTPPTEAKLKEVTAPAIVFFKFGDGANAHEEPVYQLDWPTLHDAPIARAHDLGESQNRKLLEWYLANDAQRSVWHFDRPTMTLRRLGSVSEVVAEGNYHLSTSAVKTGPSVQASR